MKVFPREVFNATQSDPKAGFWRLLEDFPRPTRGHRLAWENLGSLQTPPVRTLLSIGETSQGEHFHDTTLRLHPHFGRVSDEPYKQNMWYGLVWWCLLIGQSRLFTAWHNIWIKPQELCGESMGQVAGIFGWVNNPRLSWRSRERRTWGDFFLLGICYSVFEIVVYILQHCKIMFGKIDKKLSCMKHESQ